jgi:hypothetical protein
MHDIKSAQAALNLDAALEQLRFASKKHGVTLNCKLHYDVLTVQACSA